MYKAWLAYRANLDNALALLGFPSIALSKDSKLTEKNGKNCGTFGIGWYFWKHHKIIFSTFLPVCISALLVGWLSCPAAWLLELLDDKVLTADEVKVSATVGLLNCELCAPVIRLKCKELAAIKSKYHFIMIIHVWSSHTCTATTEGPLSLNMCLAGQIVLQLLRHSSHMYMYIRCTSSLGPHQQYFGLILTILSFHLGHQNFHQRYL